MADKREHDHLVVLVHGLADTLHAWDNCVKELRKMELSSGLLLVYASAVNARFRTHDGIDQCGARLAAEIRQLAQRHPSVKKLSFIGHSMGGMIARYACGVLFRPSDATLCGLAPVHFVTLATPHLGLTAVDGPAQVPLVTWAGYVPLLGHCVKSALQSAAHWVARTVFRGTGRHFLALDGGSGQLPLLMMMAMDAPDRGLYFFSALQAFASRACYGNVGRDHWVSWENATIRATEDLPGINPDVVRRGRGVVREDAPEAGISPDRLRRDATGPAAAAAVARPAAASATSHGNADGPAGAAAGAEPPRMAPLATHAPAEATAAAVTLERPEAGTLAGGVLPPGWGKEHVAAVRREGEEEGAGTAGAAAAREAGAAGEARAGEAAALVLERAVENAVESPRQVVSFALEQLRRLPWRRVDVSFAAARLGTAHNNIQATRWTNRVGLSVLEHLREHLQAVDELVTAGQSAHGA